MLQSMGLQIVGHDLATKQHNRERVRQPVLRRGDKMRRLQKEA